MARALLLLCLPLLAAGEDGWRRFSAGPFEVITEASPRAGRQTLARFEQFRHALGVVAGNSNLDLEMPIRVILFDSEKQRSAYPTGVLRGRDRYALVLAGERSVAPRETLRDCALLLVAANTARIPAEIDRGLADLFSTLESTGTRIVLGQPPPASERNQDWARLHLLATSPEYSGKLRVLISNLGSGMDEAAAWRNAFAKSREQIDTEAAAYLRAGQFGTIPVSGKPLNPERDYREEAFEPAAVRLALADLLLDARSRTAYESLIREGSHAAEAHEGLALLALEEKRGEAAREHLSRALGAGSRSARAHLEFGRLESDPAKSLAALTKAAELNPKLAEAFYLMAGREADPALRARHLKRAALGEPRNLVYWQALAEEMLAQKQFAEAAKAWRGAEQAARTSEERSQMKLARLAIEQQRLDHEEGERKRVTEEKQRELERLKQAAIAEVRALEERFNQPAGPDGAKVVPWWDGPKPAGRARGLLKQIDCIGRQFRLIIQGEDGRIVRLRIGDPSRIAVLGGGELALNCG
ncbi:MAG: hypothetical protein FJW37_13640, partial [Acidobacteria bacterium]|nr:hypothetical protein [Acidobacteriota bacterium]